MTGSLHICTWEPPTSADISSPLAAVKVDITNLPFEDNSFDAIICSHDPEHVRDDRGAMSEMCRVLKPGGWAIVQCPIDAALDQTREGLGQMPPAERVRLFGASNHLRVYGIDFAAYLSEAGFDVVVDSFARQLAEAAVRRFALAREEDIYFCTKPAGEAG